MRMHRMATAALAATLGLVLLLAATPAAMADWPTPLPRPARDDPSIITTAGDYDQDAADANAATYRALQDYTDQQLDLARQFNAYHVTLVATLQEQIRQRDVTYANDMNARLAELQEQQATISRLESKVDRQRATIKRLRAVIRDLRDD